MTFAPENMDESTLEATEAECLECGNQADDPTTTECEHCDDSVMEYSHVSATPLGYEDDDQFKITGLYGASDRWKYPAQDPGA